MKLLDLFCCAGGAAYGYAEAGFEVVGVDIDHQPRYPFRFVRADVFSLELKDLRKFDLIHASPMCQAHSTLNAYNQLTYPNQIAQVRELLRAAGVPYVIENVMQAPLEAPVMLCGAMFGLRLYRHRGFETSFPLVAPNHPGHVLKCARNGNLPVGDEFMTITGGKHSHAWRERAAAEMGLPWMTTVREVCEALPPAYTRYVGQQFRSINASMSPSD